MGSSWQRRSERRKTSTKKLQSVCKAVSRSEQRMFIRTSLTRQSKDVCSLGNVKCGAPFSQSSSSQSINGVTTKRTQLEFPVSGSKGSGTVRVDATEDAKRNRDVKINVCALLVMSQTKSVPCCQVRLSSGRVIRVDGDRGSGGRTIDVEWKDV